MRSAATASPSVPRVLISGSRPWSVFRPGPVMHESDATRRMHVTRQRATRRASLEAEATAGRLVVRPIVSDDIAVQPRSPTVDPLDLMTAGSSAARAGRRRPVLSGSPPAQSPRDDADGLGDRRRSPSVGGDDMFWETLRVTIPPDEQLPSASSSFTSASASSASSRGPTASAPSQSTTRTSSTTATNHNFVVLTPACPDITSVQLALGVICDDARDAQPPFSASRGPSRALTREPSSNECYPESPIVEVMSIEPGMMRRDSERSISGWDIVIDELTDDAVSRASSVGPQHLRSPERDVLDSAGRHAQRPSLPRSPELDRVGVPASPQARDHAEMRAQAQRRQAAWRDQHRSDERVWTQQQEIRAASTTQQASYSSQAESVPATMVSSLDAPSTITARAMPMPSSQESPSHTSPVHGTDPEPAASSPALLAEAQMQWQQLRRINELLRCGFAVPAWLWRGAGLGVVPERGGPELEREAGALVAQMVGMRNEYGELETGREREMDVAVGIAEAGWEFEV